jgi:flavin reductase (DIM6/NTAB) family NADH-FMN oxidoreductase RutF
VSLEPPRILICVAKRLYTTSSLRPAASLL